MRYMMVFAAVLALFVLASSHESETASAHSNYLTLETGDVDCDGDVDTVDALKVDRYLNGLSVSQNEPCPNIGTAIAFLPAGHTHYAFYLMGDTDFGGLSGAFACEGAGDVDTTDYDRILAYDGGFPPAECRTPATTGGGNYVKVKVGDEPLYNGAGSDLRTGF
ncbi:MAG: hypothetical protein WD904_09895 [Dehalococcoidia bacterium]